MKKLSPFITLLTLIIMMHGLSFQTLAANFSDIDPNSDLATKIEYLVSQNIIKGYDDGTFKPDQTINRAEALKIIFESRGIKVEEETDSGFSDIDPSQWFAKYVTSAKKIGLIKGYPDGSYRPQEKVNRAEFLKISMLAQGNYTNATKVGSAYVTFEDIDKTQWYMPYLRFAVFQNFIASGKKFNPTSGMRRDDASILIYNIMKKADETADSTTDQSKQRTNSDMASIWSEFSPAIEYERNLNMQLYNGDNDDIDLNAYTSYLPTLREELHAQGKHVFAFSDHSPFIDYFENDDFSKKAGFIDLRIKGSNIFLLNAYQSPNKRFLYVLGVSTEKGKTISSKKQVFLIDLEQLRLLTTVELLLPKSYDFLGVKRNVYVDDTGFYYFNIYPEGKVFSLNPATRKSSVLDLNMNIKALPIEEVKKILSRDDFDSEELERQYEGKFYEHKITSGNNVLYYVYKLPGEDFYRYVKIDQNTFSIVNRGEIHESGIFDIKFHENALFLITSPQKRYGTEHHEYAISKYSSDLKKGQSESYETGTSPTQYIHYLFFDEKSIYGAIWYEQLSKMQLVKFDLQTLKKSAESDFFTSLTRIPIKQSLIHMSYDDQSLYIYNTVNQEIENKEIGYKQPLTLKIRLEDLSLTADYPLFQGFANIEPTEYTWIEGNKNVSSTLQIENTVYIFIFGVDQNNDIIKHATTNRRNWTTSYPY